MIITRAIRAPRIHLRCMHSHRYSLPLPLQQSKAYIDGVWIDDTEKSLAVLDPGSHEMLGVVPDCTGEDAKRAIAAAHEALRSWSSLPSYSRAKTLSAWHDAIMEHKDDLARIVTAECGKPLAEAEGEVKYGASFVDWYAEESKRTYGRTLPPSGMTSKRQRLATIKQPLGVCAMITPWNFPLAMITRKAAPALAAGCTVVVKPAEDTPLTALALARLAEMAGIPRGVFNVVSCSRDNAADVGTVFATDSKVKKISFTGSSKVGKIVMAQSANQVKKLSLELGGNAPFIVFNDANIDAAVKGCMESKFRNAGQTCVCANRIYVQKEVFAEFTNKLITAVQHLRVGHGSDSRNAIALINSAAVVKMEQLLSDAMSKGASLLLGGSRASKDTFYFTPTVVTGITPAMRLWSEEIFGPIAALHSFSTEQEALHMANDTSAGLASYIFTRDAARVHRVSEGLECGMVGVNTGIVSHVAAPFGGIKESGFGREGGPEGIEEYLYTKLVCSEIASE